MRPLKLRTPSEKFNSCSPGVTLQEEGQVAVNNQSIGHQYVLGENAYNEGTVNLKLKLESLQNNNWMFVGVIERNVANLSCQNINNLTNPISGRKALTSPNASCEWSGSYGWVLGCNGGRVWQNSSVTIDQTLMNVSKQGDTVKLVLECEAGKLSLHLPTGKKFNIDIPKTETWRLNVTLYSSNDKIRILHD